MTAEPHSDSKNTSITLSLKIDAGYISTVNCDLKRNRNGIHSSKSPEVPLDISVSRDYHLPKYNTALRWAFGFGVVNFTLVCISRFRTE